MAVDSLLFELARARLEKLAAAEEKKNKLDAPYPGIQNLGTQAYLPVGGRREFSPEEQNLVNQGESRWLPRIFQSYSTPAHEMLASPGKQGLLYGLGGGGLGALLGAGLGGRMGNMGMGAGIGGALGAGAAGLMGYFGRRASNEDVKELMRRLPPGANKRDLLSDAAYQSDMNRDNQLASARMHQMGMWSLADALRG